MLPKFISDSEFSKTLESFNLEFNKDLNIAIGVSGGVDSLALLVLMSRYLKKRDGNLTVLHFNHKLREDSDNEVLVVKKISDRFGHKFKALTWSGSKPNSSIMKTAREKRYQSMIEYCERHRIFYLMTAHHFDDFVETFYMRSLRKYTTIGLNSIPKKFVSDSLIIQRPLIDYKKVRLIKTCEKYKLNWINDFSNQDSRFERVKIRKSFQANPTLYKKIERKIKNKILENNEIESKCCLFFLKNLIFFKFGVFVLPVSKFNNLKKSIKLEILKKILTTCSGKLFPPRVTSLSLFINKLMFKENFKYTLHSCIIEKKNKDIKFFKEFASLSSNNSRIKISSNTQHIWDNRFIIKTKKNIECFILNEKKWLLYKKYFNKKKSKLGISFEVLKTLPVISIGKKIIIPFLSSTEEMRDNGLFVTFQPRIPLSKKNF